MKIAFIVSSFPVISETFILNQITGLLDLGHDVEIFACNRSKESKVHSDVKKYSLMKKVCYINMPKNKVKRIIKAAYLILVNFYKDPLRILKSLNIFKCRREALPDRLLPLYTTILFLGNNFDIIHCHFGPIGILGAFLKSIGVARGKVVTSFYGYDISKYIMGKGKDVYNFLFEHGDVFVPICEYFKRRLIELGCNENKIIIHRIGVDLGKFNFGLRNNNSIIRLITIARLVDKKGINYGIKAVAKVAEKHSNIEYKIIGDGILRNMLEDLIVKLKVGKKIHLLGMRDQEEVIKLIRDSDILLAPSVTTKDGDQEGTPTVLMEAMATGLPVISTKHSGIPELVKDGESGFLVPERDVDALADKILYLIGHPRVRLSMGLTGRKFVEKNYNIKKLTQELEEVYQELINSGSK